jgi:hypothetical protein
MFFLVLTAGMTIIDQNADALAPLAIGAVLLVMVYAGGYAPRGEKQIPSQKLTASVDCAIR